MNIKDIASVVAYWIKEWINTKDCIKMARFSVDIPTLWTLVENLSGRIKIVYCPKYLKNTGKYSDKSFQGPLQNVYWFLGLIWYLIGTTTIVIISGINNLYSCVSLENISKGKIIK